MMTEDIKYTEINNTPVIQFADVSLTKDALNDQVAAMVDLVDNGDVDPLKAVAYLSAVEKVMKTVRDKIMFMAVEEFAKYKENQITVMDGAHISQSEAGVRYDFTNTERWNEIKGREAKVMLERKRLEATLKTLQKPGAMTTEDGELIDVNPPIRTSKTIIKVAIK